MERSCKLLSATIALKKDDMTNEYLASPHEFISGVPQGEKRSVMVTFGLHARPDVPVGMYASVNLRGQETPIKKTEYSHTYYNNLRSNLLPDGMGVFLITMEVKDVIFDKDGIYEVNVRIFPSDEMPSESNEVDSIKSYFYVLTLKGNQHG